MSAALASRVGAALESVGRREREALECRESQGMDYAAIAAQMEVKREQVADLLVAARLKVTEAVDGRPPPERVTPQCGPARRVVTAQQDGEAVGARDLDRATAHIESCEVCQLARVSLQEARLACRVWASAPAADPAPSPRRGVIAAPPASRRGRLAAIAGAIVLGLVVLAIAVGGGDGESVPPLPSAPPVGQGSAEADGEDVVPPPGDEFCLPDEPGCP